MVRIILNTIFAWAINLIFRSRTPLIITWNLTFRCQQRCQYCQTNEMKSQELETPEILDMIDKLKYQGVSWISFSGGEPLLKNDIGVIIKHAKSKNIYVSISTNGKLVLEKIEEINQVDAVCLSLDGPKDIHDGIRGEGTFKSAMRAIEACQANRIPVHLQCTLSKYSLNDIDYVIDFAVKSHLMVSFQPSTKMLQWSGNSNPVSPDEELYRQAIKKLITYKKNGAPIFNSITGLKHLFHWPHPKKLNCKAGLLMYSIEPNGLILACDERQKPYLFDQNKIENDVRKRIAKIKPMHGCQDCWCAPLVELNHIFSLNFDAILNHLRINFAHNKI